MKHVYWIACGALLACVLIFFVSSLTPDMGAKRLFADRAYHFQALRALGYIQYSGAEMGEVLATICQIPAGNEQRWFAAWNRTAERVRGLAESLHDPVSKGRAYLRAHNYYRTAEFFLPPDDEKRPECFRKSVATFRLGLQWLGVNHDLIDVPYGEHTLKAIYYPGPPGAEAKPLIVAGGGFDSTQEELYFLIVAAAHERGYAVLTYAGPGQGAVLREQGLKLTHEWEKPVGAVLDTFHARYPRPPKIILVGASMGGYLAPRAAAFEERIDGVVALGVFFDWQEIALHMRKGPDSPEFRWALANAEWTLGVRGEMEMLGIFGQYNLKDTAQHITCDVLILHGENDHYVPLKQLKDFEKALINARSITSHLYAEETGGDQHCQLGASELWRGDFFDWVGEKFGLGVKSANKAMNSD